MRIGTASVLLIQLLACGAGFVAGQAHGEPLFPAEPAPALEVALHLPLAELKRQRRKDRRMIRKLIAYPIIFFVLWLPASIQRISGSSTAETARSVSGIRPQDGNVRLVPSQPCVLHSRGL